MGTTGAPDARRACPGRAAGVPPPRLWVGRREKSCRVCGPRDPGKQRFGAFSTRAARGSLERDERFECRYRFYDGSKMLRGGGPRRERTGDLLIAQKPEGGPSRFQKVQVGLRQWRTTRESWKRSPRLHGRRGLVAGGSNNLWSARIDSPWKPASTRPGLIDPMPPPRRAEWAELQRTPTPRLRRPQDPYPPSRREQPHLGSRARFLELQERHCTSTLSLDRARWGYLLLGST